MRGTPTIFRGELLIDGYNLLHAAGLARHSYGPGEFDRTRQRLLKLLAGQLSDRERQRTTVVFDAPQQQLGPSPPTVVHGIRVIFAGGDGDADTLIERFIERNSAPRRLHVISSDHRIQRAARRRRARFFDSEVFLERIARRLTPAERTRQAEPPEKQQGLTAPGEIEAWLKAFAAVGPIADEHVPQSRATTAADSRLASEPRSVQNRTPASTTPATEAGEVAFWEQRIAQLWQQTDDEVAPVRK
jgi:uncharacterized protein